MVFQRKNRYGNRINAKAIQKEEAWADMPKEAIEYIKSLPEFNAKIFFEVTGIEV